MKKTYKEFMKYNTKSDGEDLEWNFHSVDAHKVPFKTTNQTYKD